MRIFSEKVEMASGKAVHHTKWHHPQSHATQPGNLFFYAKEGLDIHFRI
jgi:hypothetical protein